MRTARWPFPLPRFYTLPGTLPKSASADQFFKPDLKVSYSQSIDLPGVHFTYFTVTNKGISAASSVTATGKTGSSDRIANWAIGAYTAHFGGGLYAPTTLNLGTLQPGQTKTALIMCVDTHDSICKGAQLTATTPGELDFSDNTAGHGQPF